MTVVVALGGNALLPRGGSLDTATQQRAARGAARALAPVARAGGLVVTHGNGPQVGLLALTGGDAPLDVLGAETEGQIGYVLELELGNAIPEYRTVAVLTRTEVDADDPAFAEPAKFIGPVYDADEARRLADEHGWAVKPDGAGWRRVVPSPAPRAIVELEAIRSLVEAGFLVVCAGGGGVPVTRGPGGEHVGVEAVVDKDATSALLATGLGASVLVLATDVEAVRVGDRALGQVTVAELREHDFPAGSMGPKVDAACAFVERSGGRAAIGALADVAALASGTAGTQVRAG